MTTSSPQNANSDDRIPGCVLGVVEDVTDPEGEGRIRVRYPWLDGAMMSFWAPIATPMAGPDRGFQSMPEIGDEAVLCFDRGRFNHPVVIGFTWNGQDAPPDPDIRVRTWQSVNGHFVMMADAPPAGGAAGAVVVGDAHGNLITLTNGTLTIGATGTLRLRGNNIVMEVGGVPRIVEPSGKSI